MLIQRQDVQPTLNRLCFNIVCTMLKQRRFNVKTLNQRWIDVVSTLCANWDVVNADYRNAQKKKIFEKQSETYIMYILPV